MAWFTDTLVVHREDMLTLAVSEMIATTVVDSFLLLLNEIELDNHDVSKSRFFFGTQYMVMYSIA